jgi:hypothetical protein
MSTLDEQRFQAFLSVAASSDEPGFLAALKAAYAGQGIAAGLDFAAIEAFWLQGQMLPQRWRAELATQTSFTRGKPKGLFAMHGEPEKLHNWAFADAPNAGWIERGERLVLLLAPFLRPFDLAKLILPDVGFWQPNSDSVLGQGLRAWAEQLAAGTGEWAAVTAWWRAAGADSQAMATALAADQGVLDYSMAARLDGLRTLLLLVREQLLRDGLDDEHWVDVLLATYDCVTHMNTWTNEGARVELGVRHQCLLPLLQALVRSPRFKEMLNSEAWLSGNALIVLFEQVNLGALFAGTPSAFAQLLGWIPDEGLRRVRFSAEFRQARPQAALLHEQHLLARCKELQPRLRTPEALNWYLEVMDQLDSRSREEAFELLIGHCSEVQWHELITRYLRDSGNHPMPRDLLEEVDNGDYLYSYLGGRNAVLRSFAAYRLFRVATVFQLDDEHSWEQRERPDAYRQHPQNWALLLKASAAYPAEFIDYLTAELLNRDDLSRWQLLWDKANAEQRVQVAKASLQGVCSVHYASAVLELAERLFAEDAAPWHAYIADASGHYLGAQIAALGRHPTTLLQLVPAMAAAYLLESNPWFSGSAKPPLAADAVARALAAWPQAFAVLEEKAQIKLLQLFDSDAVVACRESLSKLYSSSSKLLREPAVALIARCTGAAIDASALLAAAPKARKLVLIGMALANDPAVAQLIRQHFADSAHDDYSRGLSLDALERGGHALAGLDPWLGAELATLQQQAATLKVAPAAAKYWNEAFAAVLAPLGEALGLQLLSILSEGDEQLPRRARQLLSLLPASRRADFALLAVQQWVAANGAGEADWLLLTLPVYGDERIANELVAAIKDWKKVRKQKASAAMRQLCLLPGAFGVSQARDLWESRKFSESITASAEQALGAAAARQGMSLDEFLEQLVPDFGLGHDGLLLDVGPYHYVARMRPDLSLVVLDENGKASKSLPKAKAGEDAEKRSLAESQFKVLSKNLKPVFKQQCKRLTRLFQLGTAWPSATWQKLFLDQPLMAVIAQSVVWSAVDEQGIALQRFRPDGAGELLDLHDDAYSLPAGAKVHATHPLELDEAERSAWAAHFKDYKLESPIEQWTTPVVVPEPEELAGYSVARAKGQHLNRGKFGSLVEKWGYTKGTAGDGAQIYQHTWILDGGRWEVTLNHGDIDVYFEADDTVSIDDFVVQRRSAEGMEMIALGELPPAFLNTLLAQAQTLSEHAL